MDGLYRNDTGVTVSRNVALKKDKSKKWLVSFTNFFNTRVEIGFPTFAQAAKHVSENCP